MLLGVIAHLFLNQLLQLGIQGVPGTQVYRQVHQIHRLVNRHHPWRPEQDVIGHLREAQLIVHRRAHVVRRIDGALFQSREDVGTRQADSGYPELLEYLSHHAARHPDLHALEIRQAVHRLLGMNDVGVVLNRAHVEQPVLFVDLPGFLQHAQGIEHGVPLVRLVRAGRVRGQEHRGRDLA